MKKILFIFILVLPFIWGAPCLHAAQPAADSEALKKLDEVLNNQKNILQKLEDLQKELQIVKARATR